MQYILHLVLQIKWLKVMINSGINPDTNVSVIPHETVLTTTTVYAEVGDAPVKPTYSTLSYGLGWFMFFYKDLLDLLREHNELRDPKG